MSILNDEEEMYTTFPRPLSWKVRPGAKLGCAGQGGGGLIFPVCSGALTGDRDAVSAHRERDARACNN